jgi:hypothetical protein
MFIYDERPRFDLTSTATGGEPSTMSEIFDVSTESDRLNHSAWGRVASTADAYEKRIEAIKRATGVQLNNPLSGPVGPSTMGGFGVQEETDPFADFQRQLHELAEKHPEHRTIIEPQKPISADAIGIRRRAEHGLESTWDRSDKGMKDWAARLAGGFYGALHDPAQGATLLLGPTQQAAAGIKGLLWMGLKQGAANASVEAGIQPFVQAWRAEAGLPHGFGQAALDIAAAGAFGFGVDALARGTVRGARRAVGRPYGKEQAT